MGARFWTPPKRANDMVFLSYSSDYRQSCRVLSLSALHRAHAGDGDGAIAEISAGLQLASTLETDPTSIGVMIRSACAGMMASRVQYALARSNPSGESLRSLLVELRDSEQLPFLFALRAEGASFAMGFDQFDKRQFVELARSFILYDSIMPGDTLDDFLHRDETPTLDALLGAAYPLAGGLIRLNEAKQLEVVRRALELWHLDLDSFKAQMGVIEDECRVYPLAKAFVELYPGLKNGGLIHTAHIRCVRAGICAELFRRTNGRLPDKPADLVPEFMSEVPDDPFTGKPLAFDRRHGVLEIYCSSQDVDPSEHGGPKNVHFNSFKLYDRK